MCFWAVPSSVTGPFANKYGFNTETAGNISVRTNVVFQRHVKEKPRSKVEPVANLKRTVSDILGSLRASRSKQSLTASSSGSNLDTGSGFLRTVHDAQLVHGRGDGNMPDYAPAFGDGLTAYSIFGNSFKSIINSPGISQFCNCFSTIVFQNNCNILRIWGGQK